MGTASKSMYIRCMENKATNTVTNDQGKVRLSLVHDSAFVNAIETMKNFYFEMNPDMICVTIISARSQDVHLLLMTKKHGICSTMHGILSSMMDSDISKLTHFFLNFTK